jgi:hypothetical protein
MQSRKSYNKKGKKQVLQRSFKDRPLVEPSKALKPLVGLQGKFEVPIRRKAIPKDENISLQAAYAKMSALAATRLALPINFSTLSIMIDVIARFMSYEMQARLNPPQFVSGSITVKWNPSMVKAYLFGMFGTYFAKCGYLQSSTQFQVLGSYVLPTFVAKFLQQHAPVHHMNRLISASITADLNSFFTAACGTGGLIHFDEFVSAPCYVASGNDTEGYWSVAGPAGQPAITFATLSVDQLNDLSAEITKAFPHTVALSKIPVMAASTELKVTPVVQSLTGQFIFSCVDEKTMCDLLLPLCSFYEPTMLNSPNPMQTAAPVRIDGNLASSQGSKVAFLFWLANQHPFDPKHTFLYYLGRFGVKPKHYGNLQVNIRSVNWNAVQFAALNYIKILVPSASNLLINYFLNYVSSIVTSNIPGCFRAVSPISIGYGVSKMNSSNGSFPNYSCFAKNPKAPTFILHWLKSLRTPIRNGNQITFFWTGVPPPSVTLPFWAQIAASATGSLGTDANYQAKPSLANDTGLSWTGGPYNPYELSLLVGPPAGYADAVRNMIVLKGLSSQAASFQNLFISAGNQALFNQWINKPTNFTVRNHRFYIACTLTNQTQVGFFKYYQPVPDLIASYEPAGYHATLISLAYIITYFIPNSTLIPTIAPLFSSNPTSGADTITTTAMMAGTPGQGTQNTIAVGASSNPGETIAHIEATSIEGVIPDSTEPPPEHLKDKIKKKVEDTTTGLVADTVTAGKKVAKDAVQKGIKALLDVAV